jgi:ribosome-associated toxin RatA of RatAB toxin-antitoxin module
MFYYMGLLEFSMILPTSPEKFIEYFSDYESLSKFFPSQLKSIKIIEQNSVQMITEEIISFSTVFRNEISQKTVHHKPQNNEMFSEIISGPAKGTTILVKFNKILKGTEIHVNVELNLSLKAKFLSPLIKKFYKNVLMGLFYKINNVALQLEKPR